MLVLSRFPGQRIFVGPDLVLKVIRVKGNRVQLGLQAPPSVSIVRGEIADNAAAPPAPLPFAPAAPRP